MRLLTHFYHIQLADAVDADLQHVVKTSSNVRHMEPRDCLVPLNHEGLREFTDFHKRRRKKGRSESSTNNVNFTYFVHVW